MTLPRALELGNPVVTEITARELGQINLDDALNRTALAAAKKHPRARRMAAGD